MYPWFTSNRLNQSYISSTGGLLSWYDASDESTIDNPSGLVGQLNDKTGHGYHVTASGSTRPTSGAATINSLNVLSFGADDFMSVASLPLGADVTIFLVFRPVTINSEFDSALSYGNSGNGTWQLDAADASAFYGRINGNLGHNNTTSLTDTDMVGSTSLFTMRLNSSDNTMIGWLNGTEKINQSDYSIDIAASGTLRIGSNRLGDQMPVMLFCESAIFKGALEDHFRLPIEDELTSKWGIS